MSKQIWITPTQIWKARFLKAFALNTIKTGWLPLRSILADHMFAVPWQKKLLHLQAVKAKSSQSRFKKNFCKFRPQNLFWKSIRVFWTGSTAVVDSKRFYSFLMHHDYSVVLLYLPFYWPTQILLLTSISCLVLWPKRCSKNVVCSSLLKLCGPKQHRRWLEAGTEETSS